MRQWAAKNFSTKNFSGCVTIMSPEEAIFPSPGRRSFERINNLTQRPITGLRWSPSDSRNRRRQGAKTRKEHRFVFFAPSAPLREMLLLALELFYSYNALGTKARSQPQALKGPCENLCWRCIRDRRRTARHRPPRWTQLAQARCRTSGNFGLGFSASRFRLRIGRQNEVLVLGGAALPEIALPPEASRDHQSRS